MLSRDRGSFCGSGRRERAIEGWACNALVVGVTQFHGIRCPDLDRKSLSRSGSPTELTSAELVNFPGQNLLRLPAFKRTRNVRTVPLEADNNYSYVVY